MVFCLHMRRVPCGTLAALAAAVACSPLNGGGILVHLAVAKNLSVERISKSNQPPVLGSFGLRALRAEAIVPLRRQFRLGLCRTAPVDLPNRLFGPTRGSTPSRLGFSRSESPWESIALINAGCNR